MKKRILLFGLLLTMMLSCKPQTKTESDITVDDLKVVLKSDANIQLLDVRTPKEWEEGVINNPIKIDVTGDDFEGKALEKLDKNQPVYIYCRSGGRSKRASELLAKKGYKVYNVLGGILEWNNK